MSGGTATFNGTVITGALTQSAGQLNGSGTLTATGASSFSGGTQSGSGTTFATGGAAFSLTGFGLDGGRTLQLGGASTATGTFVQISLNAANPNTGVSDAGSGSLTIASGATFTDQTTSSGLTITAPSQGGTDTAATSAVNNAGTFIKSGSALTSTISARFNNTGTVSIQAGTLVFSGGGQISGSFALALGAFLQFNSNYTLNGSTSFLGGAISGTGTLTIGAGATAEVSSSISGATIAFANGSGTLTLDNPTTFQSSITGLTVGDTINLPGIAVQSAVVSGSTLMITQTNNQTLQYQVSGALTGNSFSILSNAAGTKLILLPSTGTTITGANNAGTLTFNPNSTQFYKLGGATITGSTGYGILVQTSDSNLADNLIVQADSASSISVTGTNFDGIRVATSGANIFVFDAAPISSARFAIGAFNNGSGSITISSSGQLTSASSGINASNQSATVAAAANSIITVSAAGTINSGTVPHASGSQPSGILAGYLGGSSSTPNLNVNGTVVVNNSANITAAAGWGINAYNYGSGDVTVNNGPNTTITGAQYGIAAANRSGGSGNVTVNVAPNATINGNEINGILALTQGSGSISVTTSVGDLISGLSGSTGGVGIVAVNQATSIPVAANSSIVVNSYGTIRSGTAQSGSGSPPAGITAGYFGGTTVPASLPVTGLFGDVWVNNSADITAAAGDGIRAYNYGIGDVTVNDNSGTIIALGGASPTNGFGCGVAAYNYGTGNIFVTTGDSVVIQSGSSGISAVSQAPAAPATTTVSVFAHGTITPGTIPSGTGNAAAGILAGYDFNGAANANVAGTVIIDNWANISAPSGDDGIRGFNYGTGDILITVEQGAAVSGGRLGVGGVGLNGGDVYITNSGSISGGTAGVVAQTTGAGHISIINLANGIIQEAGASTSPALSLSYGTNGSAIVENFGTIEAYQSSASALAFVATGGSLTINNHAHLVGDINVSNAVFNNAVGADWQFGGTNVFASGINVIDNDGAVTSQGAGGTIQITVGSLAIFGTIQGTLNYTIGDGATLELEKGASVGQTVTFLGPQGTLKLDHSLSSPFTGVISNLTGTSLIHNNIDLADMSWSATASAHYIASAATSGALTVNDGAGHSLTLQLINYSGDGTFFVQNDGNGGTLVFDPPAVPAISSDSIAGASTDTSFDKATYDNDGSALSGIDVNLAFGIVTGDAAIGTGTLRSVEGIRGTNFADTYNAGDFGAAGFLDAFVNNVGSFGTFNEFEGGGGNDSVVGNGSTRIAFYSASDGVTVDLTAGTSHGAAAGDLAGVGTDSFSGVNAVRGSGFDDLISGGAGSDTLDGQRGNDTIQGKGGADILIGGAGADRFIFSAVSDSTVAASDTISDFVHGSDLIDSSAISGITSVQGLINGATQVSAHSIGWIQSGADTIVYMNSSASAEDQTATDMKIILTGATASTLTSADFFHF